MIVELEQQLASVPLLAGLESRVRKRLADIGKRRTYAADEAIVREIGEIKAGDFFGELALIEEHPRSATVIAAEETDCLLFPAWEFTSLLEEHPEIAVPIMRALIARLHRREHHTA
jgi:CRP-like cAMP-binding protein